MTTTRANPTAGVMPVQMPGARVRFDRPDRLLVVTDPDLGDVSVRWRLTSSDFIWRCSSCGPQTKAECPHTFAAGLHLAESLLGLTPLANQGATS